MPNSVVLSALAVYNVYTLYFNARSFPEKSAKTGNLSTIKTQCPSQLSCIRIRAGRPTSRHGMAGPQELHQRTQLLYFLLLYLPNQFNVSGIEYLFTI